eukprot:455210-Prymnesium_polylepis.1
MFWEVSHNHNFVDTYLLPLDCGLRTGLSSFARSCSPFRALREIPAARGSAGIDPSIVNCRHDSHELGAMMVLSGPHLRFARARPPPRALCLATHDVALCSTHGH